MAEAAFRPIAALAQELAEGKTTSRRLVEAALARVADAGGEGGRVFTKVHAQGALVAADASDRLRKQGVVPSPLAGLPVSIKRSGEHTSGLQSQSNLVCRLLPVKKK